MRSPGPLLIVLTLTLAAPLARAQEEAPPPEACRARCPELPCALDAGRCLLAAGHARAARDLLKAAADRSPGHTRLGLLLARAYWAMGNQVWARRVLLQLATRRPDDCQVRAWLIWLHLQLAELDEAQVRLGADGCPDPGPERTRWALLQAALERLRQSPEAAATSMEKALGQDEIFPEDRHLLEEMKRYAMPLRPAPVTLRLDVGAGYASNGMGANPSDPRANLPASTTESPAFTLDALARFEPTWHSFVNPRLELGLRGLLLTRQDPVDMGGYSYLNLSARPGISLGNVRVYYHGQLFLLGGGDPVSKGAVQVGPSSDGPRWFYESHRGEVELDPVSWMTLFAGAGRTIFREAIRSRTEVDGGLGIHGKAWRLHLLGGVSMRGHWGGDSEVLVTLPSGTTRQVLISPYDLYGGTLLLSATLPLPYLSVRARVVAAFDTYLRSEGYFDMVDLFPDDDPITGREDVLIKGGLEVWSRAWLGLRAGATYEATHRYSTKAAYTYTDHRVLGRVRFTFSFDPFGPSTMSGGQGHEPLPYSAQNRDVLDDQRIQDMLRQEDSARRGSSCIN